MAIDANKIMKDIMGRYRADMAIDAVRTIVSHMSQDTDYSLWTEQRMVAEAMRIVAEKLYPA